MHAQIWIFMIYIYIFLGIYLDLQIYSDLIV